MNNIGIIIGSFHKKESDEMLDEAREACAELGLNIVQEVWVPGSLEKPLALKRMLSRNVIDGAVVLGIIEQGETKHGLIMGQTVMDAIIRLQLDFMKPVGVGILGPDIKPSQIPPRVRPYARAAIKAVHAMIESK